MSMTTAVLIGAPEQAACGVAVVVVHHDLAQGLELPVGTSRVLFADQERDRVVDEQGTVLRGDSAGADEDRDPLHDGGEEQL
jgi:hypothetical protein